MIGAVVALAMLGSAASAGATTVTLGPSPLDTGPNSTWVCDGPACTSRSFVHVVSSGGAFLTAGRGKIVRWRVVGSFSGNAGVLQLWVVRPGDGSTRAVAGPSLATNLAGGPNAVSPPLPFEAGDSIAVTAVPGPGLSSAYVRYVDAQGFMRMFQPGFTALGSPLTPLSDQPHQMQFNADLALAPVVSASAPASGPNSGGTSVAITGSNLDGATQVTFGGTPATFNVASANALIATAPPGTAGSTVDVRVTSPGGTSPATAAARFTYTDKTAPVLSGLAIKPRSFARKKSARVTYTLSEPANTTFTVKRKYAGVKIGGTCLKAMRRVLAQLRGRPRKCTLLKSVRGSFARNGVKGSNRFRFTARLRGRKLAAGRYVLRATPKDAVGNKGKTRSVAFKIRRR